MGSPRSFKFAHLLRTFVGERRVWVTCVLVYTRWRASISEMWLWTLSVVLVGVVSQLVTGLGLCVSLELAVTHIWLAHMQILVFIGKCHEFRIERSFGVFCTGVYLKMSRTEEIVQTPTVVNTSHSGKGSWLDCESGRKKIKYCNIWGWL